MTKTREYFAKIDRAAGMIYPVGPDGVKLDAPMSVPADLLADISEAISETIPDSDGYLHINYTLWVTKPDGVNVSENIH